MSSETTFGETISSRRKDKQLSQKELAQKIMREDGSPISAQYLNDIEHNRRNPSLDYLVKQFAEILNIDEGYLYFLAGKLPEDRDRSLPEEKVVEAMKVFRRG